MRRRAERAAGVVEDAKAFLETLTAGVAAPDASNFEPEALAKELTSTEQLGQRGEAYFAGQLALLFLVFVPLLDLSVLVRLLGVAAFGLGAVMILAGAQSTRHFLPHPN